MRKKPYRFIKTYSQICALNSCDGRHSEKLTVNRQLNKNLTVNRQNDLFLTVNRQRDPPIETLFKSYRSIQNAVVMFKFVNVNKLVHN